LPSFPNRLARTSTKRSPNHTHHCVSCNTNNHANHAKPHRLFPRYGITVYPGYELLKRALFEFAG